ncbi:MAG: hypothetical protein AAGI63_19405, partial [Planctomycetota bacterium]
LASLPPEHLVTLKRNEWEFFTFNELQEPIRVDEFRATKATQLGAFVKMYKSHGATAADGPKKTQFPFERLANSIALAEDNEDILFTDPSDAFSMWKLEPAECKVRPLKYTILKFIEDASVEDLEAD